MATFLILIVFVCATLAVSEAFPFPYLNWTRSRACDKRGHDSLAMAKETDVAPWKSTMTPWVRRFDDPMFDLMWSPGNTLAQFMDDMMHPARTMNMHPIRVDATETDAAYVIKADLPGISKEQANVEVDEGRLIISYERVSEDKKETEKMIRMERHEGKSTRTFLLPDDADEDKIEAAYENGILTVQIAKIPPEQATKMTKSVKIN
jgi:HSP20 family protein